MVGWDNAEFRLGTHLFQVILQEVAGELQIDEPRHNGLHHAVVVGVQLLSHSPGDLNGGAVVLLGGGQRAVALVFAQVRPVGNRHAAEAFIIAGLFKGPPHFFGNDIQDFFHRFSSFFRMLIVMWRYAPHHNPIHSFSFFSANQVR